MTHTNRDAIGRACKRHIAMLLACEHAIDYRALMQCRTPDEMLQKVADETGVQPDPYTAISAAARTPKHKWDLLLDDILATQEEAHLSGRPERATGTKPFAPPSL